MKNKSLTNDELKENLEKLDKMVELLREKNLIRIELHKKAMDDGLIVPGTFAVMPAMLPQHIKGMFKEAISALRGNANNASSGLSAFKKAVDLKIFVEQKAIPLFAPEYYLDPATGKVEMTLNPKTGRLRVFERPLRADTAQGPRTALASSEILPAGTQFWLTLNLLDPTLYDIVAECLDYKEYGGMLQYRSAGYGSFVWSPCDEYGNVIDEMPKAPKFAKKKSKKDEDA